MRAFCVRLRALLRRRKAQKSLNTLLSDMNRALLECIVSGSKR